MTFQSTNNPNAQILFGYRVDRASVQQVVNVNRQVVTSTVQTARAVKDSFSSAGGLGDRLREAEKRAEKLAKIMERVKRESQSAANVEFNNLRRATTGQRATTGGGRGLGAAVDTGTQRAQQILGGLGQGELANLAGLIGDITQAAQDAPGVLGNLKQGILNLGAAAPLAAGALAGLVIGLAIFQRQIEEASNLLNAAVAAQQNYATAIATLNEESARARVQELERTAEAQRQLAADLQAQVDSARAQAGEFGDAFTVNLQRVLLEQNATFQGLVSAANTASSAASEAETEIQLLNSGLSAGAFAANNATQSEADLAAARERNASIILGWINTGISQEIEMYRLLTSASAESVQARIEENRVRLELMNEEIGRLTQAGLLGDQASADAAAQLTQDYIELTEQTRRLEQETLPAVQVRERETEAVRQFRGAMQESIRAEQERVQAIGQINQRIRDLNAQIAEQDDEYRRSDERENRDFRRQRLYEDIDFRASQAAAEREFQQGQLESIQQAQAEQQQARDDTLQVEAEFAQAEIKRIEDLEKRLAEIRRKASLEITEAAGELDAKRVLAALNAREQELQDAQSTNDEQSKENTKARDERLKQIAQETQERAQQLQARLAQERVAFQLEQRSREDEFRERRRREDEARSIARSDELADRTRRRQTQVQQLIDLQNALEQEKGMRQRSLREALGDMQGFFSSLSQLARNARAGLGTAGTTGMGGSSAQQIAARLTGAQSSTGAGTSTGSRTPLSSAQVQRAISSLGSTGAVKRYQHGGQASGLAMTGEQGRELAFFGRAASIIDNASTERLLSALERGGGGGSINATINVNGAQDPRAVALEIRRELAALAGMMGRKQ